MKRNMSVLFLLLINAAAHADPATQAVTQPATQIARAELPVTQPATKPAVTQLLGEMDLAYSKLAAARFDGNITGSFDVEGQQRNYEEAFSSSYAAPNQFRHEAKDDILLGSTGKTAYAYLKQRDQYQSFDAPRAKTGLADWPPSIITILADQNPSLLLAISRSASVELNELSRRITLEAPTVIEGVSYDTLRFDAGDDHEIITMLVDPATHLLKRVVFDKREPMKKAGAKDVNVALITVTYSLAATATSQPAETFAWIPPAGAIQVSPTAAAPKQ